MTVTIFKAGVPNLGKNSSSSQQKRISYGDESYNSFKSTTSMMGATTNTNTNSSCGSANLDGLAGTHLRQHSSPPSTSSSIDGSSSVTGANDHCGLSVSLKKFFKHNQLSDSKMRQEMMRQVNVYSSGQLDRTEDAVYSSTMEVINAVRQLLKGVQEVNTSEYVDLVKVSRRRRKRELGKGSNFLLCFAERRPGAAQSAGERRLAARHGACGGHRCGPLDN